MMLLMVMVMMVMIWIMIVIEDSGDDEDDDGDDEYDDGEEEDNDGEEEDVEEDQFQDWEAHFVRVCTVEMHIRRAIFNEMFKKQRLQTPPGTLFIVFCKPTQSKGTCCVENAGRPEYHLD